jgi:hypothetical protein
MKFLLANPKNAKILVSIISHDTSKKYVKSIENPPLIYRWFFHG